MPAKSLGCTGLVKAGSAAACYDEYPRRADPRKRGSSMTDSQNTQQPSHQQSSQGQQPPQDQQASHQAHAGQQAHAGRHKDASPAHAHQQSVKTTWAIILASVLIGLGAFGVGLAVIGFVSDVTTYPGLRFTDGRTGQSLDSNRSPNHSPVTATDDGSIEYLNQITVSAVAANIVLTPAVGDLPGFSVKTDDMSRYLISTDDGHLRIEYQTGFNLFGLGLNQNSLDEIIITIPAQTQLNSVGISSVSGNISIENALFANRLNIDSVSGDISIESLSGANTADPAKGSDVHISMVSGTTRVKQATLSSLIFDQVSGSASFGVTNLDDIRFEVSSVSGTVTSSDSTIMSGLGGNTSGSGPIRASINTVSGNVDLYSVTAP